MNDSIDPELLAAAEQTIAIAGWPSRDRAPVWLAVILREATTAAIEQAVGAMAAEMAQVRDANATLMGALERLQRQREADRHPHGSMAASELDRLRETVDRLQREASEAVNIAAPGIRAAEREACAEIAEKAHSLRVDQTSIAMSIANAIRSRA